ncbi:MAG: hypothetical protein QNJ40_26525 [Xanthomonadales bacterium]|nr:hypothetical protein [Xanthomonadales bacterium]
MNPGHRSAGIETVTRTGVATIGLIWVTSAVSQATFTGDVPFVGDNFGRSVAIEGNIAVVGAPGDDENGAEAGAAYVYTRSGGNWSLLQKIAGTEVGAQFGFSVAVELDESGLNEGDFIAVGSLFGDGQVANSGTVTMFRRQDPSPTFAFQQTLSAGDGRSFDEFGYAIDLDLSIPSNSLGNDPVYTLVVGAPDWNERGLDAGAIYICALSPDGTAWACYDKMVPDDIGGGDLLGRAVSISGDDILAGATGWPSGNHPDGVVYIMRRFNDTGAGFFNWEVNNTLKPSDGVLGDRFGASVAIFGLSLAVGSEAAAATQFGAEGAVYLFENPIGPGTFNERGKILPPDLANSLNFGSQVVIDRTLMAVTDRNGVGQVHFYSARGVDWVPIEVLSVADPDAGQIGNAMAFSVPNALTGDRIRTGGGAAYIVTNQVIFDAGFEN